MSCHFRLQEIPMGNKWYQKLNIIVLSNGHVVLSVWRIRRLTNHFGLPK